MTPYERALEVMSKNRSNIASGSSGNLLLDIESAITAAIEDHGEVWMGLVSDAVKEEREACRQIARKYFEKVCSYNDNPVALANIFGIELEIKERGGKVPVCKGE